MNANWSKYSELLRSIEHGKKLAFNDFPHIRVCRKRKNKQ